MNTACRTGLVCILSGLTVMSSFSLSAEVDTSAYMKKVLMTAAEGFVPAGTTLSDFPVLVRLGSHISGFSYGDVMSGGADILFTDADATVSYPYEIQSWNTGGESLVWVKVPELTSETEFVLWYGSGTATVNTPSDVWTSYHAVLHLDEDAETFACADSSGNGFGGTARAHTLGYAAGGKVGGYRDNWANKDNDPTGIVLPAMTAMQLGTNFTFSTWLRRGEGSSIGWDHILMCCTSAGDVVSDGGVLVMLDGGDNRLTLMGYQSDWNVRIFDWDPVFAMGTAWDHFAISFDGNQCTYYINGVPRRSGQMTGAVTERDMALCIGALSSETGANPWRGDFDEARLRVGSSSSEWVNAEYATMNSVGSLSYGSAIAPGIVPPAFDGKPTVVRQADGTVAVSATLTSDVAATVYAIFNETLRLEVGAAAAGGTVSKTFEAADFGETATTWTAKVVAISADDAEVSSAIDGSFMTGGEVSVAAGADAYERKLVSGSFIVSRPASATQHALSGTLTLGGTAVQGQTYEMETSFTIPEGSSSVSVAVVPLDCPAVEEDVTVVATVAAGPYAASAVSATVTVVNKVAAALELSQDPIVINGHLNVWVEDFTGNVSDYILQRRSESGAWTTYGNLAVGSNNPSTGHPFGPCIFGTEGSLRGVSNWRIASVEAPELWTEFTVDARYPMSGTPIGSHNSYENGPANTVNGKLDDYFLASGNWWSMWVGVDFGEERTVEQIAYLPNGSDTPAEEAGGASAYFEYADNPEFENSVRFAELSATDLERTRLHVITLAQPVKARYFRIQSGYNGWFSVWELELGESMTVAPNPSTGDAVVSVSPALSAENAVAVLRSKSASGPYSKVGEIARGATSLTNSIPRTGQTFYYKVAPILSGGSYVEPSGDGKPCRKEYRLDRDPAVANNALREGFSLYAEAHADDAHLRWVSPAAYAFDGDESTAPDQSFNWGGGTAYYATALGVDAGKKENLHVSRCRIKVPSNFVRGSAFNGLAVYGSNTDVALPDHASVSAADWNAYFTEFVRGATRLSSDVSDATAGEWIDLDCDPVEGYRYIYVFDLGRFEDNSDGVRGDLGGWCGSAAELQFFGWMKNDLKDPGFIVIVR